MPLRVARLKLLRPDSLDGWTYGEMAPTAWKVSEGCLSGSDKSTPLLSGFSAEDCELRFQWSVSPEGAWKILMPKVPRGPSLQLILSDVSDCGRLCYDGKVLFSGVKIPQSLKKGHMHIAAISRQASKLSLSIDGSEIFQADITPGRYGLGVAVARGNCELADLRSVEPRGKPLIENDSLANWNCQDKDSWRVEKGELFLQPKLPHKYLRSNKEYDNFLLSFQYKMQNRGNSGLAIRTPHGGWPSTDGMEIQIEDRLKDEPLNSHSQMSIYGNVRPLARRRQTERVERYSDQGRRLDDISLVKR